MFTTALRRAAQKATLPATRTIVPTALKSKCSKPITSTLTAPNPLPSRSYSTFQQHHQKSTVKSTVSRSNKIQSQSRHISSNQKRRFTTEQTPVSKKSPQDPLPAEASAETTTTSPSAAIADESAQFTQFSADLAYDPAVHRQKLEAFMAGDWPREPNPEYWAKLLPPPDQMQVFQYRFPGMFQRLKGLLEFDLHMTSSANAEGAATKDSFQKEMWAKYAEKRTQMISELSFPDVNILTGAGLTPIEHHAMFQKVVKESSIRTAATMKIQREEFYEKSKKEGLYKNSLLNRLFNSKEDMLQARPSKSEWSASEHAKTQPRSWMPLISMAVFSSLGVLYLKYLDTQNVATATVINYQTSGTLSIGGDFEDLVDQFGKEANSKQYRGFYPLYYFGFTKCPDICPTELHKMMAALDTIETNQPDLYRYIKPVFISVDPLRDTPEQIQAYAENFHPRMRWLTGTSEALTKAAKEFHIYFSIPDDATPDGDYNVDHSIFFFLMDREGKLLSYYGQNKNSQEIATAMAAVVQDDLNRDQYEKTVHGNKM